MGDKGKVIEIFEIGQEERIKEQALRGRSNRKLRK
jgi:hypothetical protein